ncbi:CDGSH iron-sulfur domain-containing protein [Sphaerothrix gracilis]|uniref:CDGSH iron-sulfur domain-containing protein n=1 Tax=Sphaerothrix gracilis TaxID=3151835 RepID=UPI0031FE2CED
MTQTSSADAARHVLTLEAGTYWICACGRSRHQPHCDGSHAGTPFQPLTLELESPKQIEVETPQV